MWHLYCPPESPQRRGIGLTRADIVPNIIETHHLYVRIHVGSKQRPEPHFRPPWRLPPRLGGRPVFIGVVDPFFGVHLATMPYGWASSGAVLRLPGPAPEAVGPACDVGSGLGLYMSGGVVCFFDTAPLDLRDCFVAYWRRLFVQSFPAYTTWQKRLSQQRLALVDVGQATEETRFSRWTPFHRLDVFASERVAAFGPRNEACALLMLQGTCNVSWREGLVVRDAALSPGFLFLFDPRQATFRFAAGGQSALARIDPGLPRFTRVAALPARLVRSLAAEPRPHRADTDVGVYRRRLLAAAPPPAPAPPPPQPELICI